MEWDFDEFEQWVKEKDQILSLDLKGADSDVNINKLSRFVTQTIDYLADPSGERKIPIEMFEISEIISNKIKGSDTKQFYML